MAIKSNTLTPKQQSDIKNVIEKAKKQGFISQDDILMIFPHAEDHVEAIDKLYDQFYKLGVDIFESVAEEEAAEEVEEASDLQKELELLVSLENKKIADPVRMYLREIGRIPLLTREQEIDLARKTEAYEVKRKIVVLNNAQVKQVGEQPTDEEITKLIKENYEYDIAVEEVTIWRQTLPQQGLTYTLIPDDPDKISKQDLTTANLRLVVSIAKKYIGRGMSFLDLIQEGNKGLIRAVEKYDWKRGYKFSTYATWWIRQAITRAIADQARTIRIPVHMVETINKLVRTQRRLMQELGREPTPEEVSKDMEIEPEKVREIMKISQKTTSLETPIGDDEDSYLGDFIADETTESPYELTSKRLLRENLMEVLAALSDREAKVLKMRFGLDGKRPMTLEEVGAEFGVTRERIRQIEA
ncbi:RNA polymerase sigma factor RpoD, partial [Candidatus Beckwithbacteria bacterium CG23_combo_of_CG06-09_8_20_14_all_34_8]